MTTFTDELLTLDLQFFAEGDGEGDETPDETNEETPDQTEPKTVTMTQEELDALIGREKGRVKGKYADYDELKTKLAEYETAQAEQEREKLSEIERLQADLDAKASAEQTLTEQLTALREQAKQDKIKQEFAATAQANGITYVDAAFKLADMSSVSVNDAGEVEGIKELVETLAAANPFLMERKTQKPIGEPTNNGRGVADEQTKDQLLAEAAEKAKRTGLPADRVAYAKLKRELT